MEFRHVSVMAAICAGLQPRFGPPR